MTAFVTEVCPDCGNLRSVCSDPSIPWYPQRSYCYPSAAVMQTWRRTRERFESPKHDDPSPHVTDGLKWGMSQFDLTPQDDFFGEGSFTPGQQAEDHEDHGAEGE